MREAKPRGCARRLTREHRRAPVARDGFVFRRGRGEHRFQRVDGKREAQLRREERVEVGTGEGVRGAPRDRGALGRALDPGDDP